jgi:hypothetical protein
MRKLFLPVAVCFLLFNVLFAQDNSIERYLNIRSAGSPTFNKDGSQMTDKQVREFSLRDTKQPPTH